VIAWILNGIFSYSSCNTNVFFIGSILLEELALLKTCLRRGNFRYCFGAPFHDLICCASKPIDLLVLTDRGVKTIKMWPRKKKTTFLLSDPSNRSTLNSNFSVVH
jgi:hypothetical protein